MYQTEPIPLGRVHTPRTLLRNARATFHPNYIKEAIWFLATERIRFAGTKTAQNGSVRAQGKQTPVLSIYVRCRARLLISSSIGFGGLRVSSFVQRSRRWIRS